MKHNTHTTPMRKVTMNLPASLVESATEVLGKGNLTEAVREALKEALHREACKELLAMRGKVKFAYDWKQLRAMED